MSDQFTKRLSISAFPDGVTYIVTLEDLDTGQKQNIEGIVATSEEDAINQTIDALNKGVREAFGDQATVTTGELEYD